MGALVTTVVVATAGIAGATLVFLFRDDIRRRLDRYASRNPTLYALTVLLPVNVALTVAVSVRRKALELLNRSQIRPHERRVQDVQRQVLDWHRTGKRGMLCTRRRPDGFLSDIGVQPLRYKRLLTNVDVDLDRILNVDAEALTARVEPMVRVADLAAVLLPKGLGLPVVPSVAGMTVGGAVLCGAVDASSGRHGLFHAACTALEVIMPDGRLVRATPSENADLFAAIPLSRGALGILVAVELRLVHVRPFVQIEYIPHKDRAEALRLFVHEAMRSATPEGPLFVEAFVFADGGVVVSGTEMGDVVSTDPVHEIGGHFYSPWFHEYAHGHLEKGRATEIAYRGDYHQRHRPSRLFEACDTLPFGNRWPFRALLGWAAPVDPRVVDVLQVREARVRRAERHLSQTYIVPMKELAPIVDAIDKSCKVYPLWICPLRVPAEGSRDALVHPRPDGDEMYAAIVVRGRATAEPFSRKEALRAVAAAVRQRGGFSLQCGDAMVVESKEEQRANLNTRTFDRLRDKTGCAVAFPDPFEKMGMGAKDD